MPMLGTYIGAASEDGSARRGIWAKDVVTVTKSYVKGVGSEWDCLVAVCAKFGIRGTPRCSV